jgi:glycosyltransferase involved in cell wall biosynthesis
MTSFVVVAAARSSNALGRALTLADISARLGAVEVWAYDDGPLWSGAPRWSHPVTPFRSLKPLRSRIEQLSRRGSVVVWLSKGFPPQASLGRWAQKHPGATLVVDFDDDDVALAEEFRALSLRNRAILHGLRRTGVGRVRRSQRRLAQTADAITFSSNALEERLCFPGSVRRARVVHARRAVSAASSTGPVEARRIAFLGTVRPHKGVDRLVALISRYPDLVGVTFAQDAWAPPAALRDRWIMVDPLAPLEEIWSQVDVAVIPSEWTSAGAQVQLPAKAIDAVAADVPLLASPTPALREVLGEGFIAVEDWSPEVVRAVLEDSHGLSDARTRAREVFRDRLSVESSAAILAELLSVLERR